MSFVLSIVACFTFLYAALQYFKKVGKRGLPYGFVHPDVVQKRAQGDSKRKPKTLPERDRYLKKKIPSDLDAIVIGSGIGGLSVAAFLARVGKRVLVLEQHYIAGGCCHTFDSGGFSFSTGIHYIGNIDKRKPILDLITEHEVEWTENGQEGEGRKVYDEIVIGDKVYEFRSGEQNFINDLAEKFPKERENIVKYIELVKKVAQKDKYFDLKIVRPMWLQTLLRPLLCQGFYKYAGRTAYDVIKQEITDNEDLIAVLCGQFGDYGPPPKIASFFMHCSVVNHYLEGGYFPKGGPGRFAREIIPVIEKAGGRVLVGKKVQKILVHNDAAYGVQMENGDEIRAPIVVSDAGAPNTFGRLLPEVYAKRFGLADVMRKIPPSVSYNYLFVGLNGTPEELKLRSSNIWVWPERDYSAMLDKFEADPAKAPIPMFIAMESAKDAAWSETHPGKATAILLTLGKLDWYKKWEEKQIMHRGADYEALKKQFADRMFEEGLFRFYPHLRDKVAHWDVGTPLSTQHYINAWHGECYGLDCPPERFTEVHQLQPTTCVKNLFLTGQDVSVLGFTGALMGGVLAAHSILGYGHPGDILSSRNLIEDIMYMEKKFGKTHKSDKPVDLRPVPAGAGDDNE